MFSMFQNPEAAANSTTMNSQPNTNADSPSLVHAAELCMQTKPTTDEETVELYEETAEYLEHRKKFSDAAYAYRMAFLATQGADDTRGKAGKTGFFAKKVIETNTNCTNHSYAERFLTTYVLSPTFPGKPEEDLISCCFTLVQAWATLRLYSNAIRVQEAYLNYLEKQGNDKDGNGEYTYLYLNGLYDMAALHARKAMDSSPFDNLATNVRLSGNEPEGSEPSIELTNELNTHLAEAKNMFAKCVNSNWRAITKNKSFVVFLLCTMASDRDLDFHESETQWNILGKMTYPTLLADRQFQFLQNVLGALKAKDCKQFDDAVKRYMDVTRITDKPDEFEQRLIQFVRARHFGLLPLYYVQQHQEQ